MAMDDRRGNCAALRAIGASMRSLLGPNKSLKCCVAHVHSEQESTVLGDAMQVMDALADRTEHPVGAILHDACLSHHTAYGNGVTTLVAMAALWAGELLLLINDEGAPPAVVFALFEEALGVCSEVFTAIAISLDVLGMPQGHVWKDTVKHQQREAVGATRSGRHLGRLQGRPLTREAASVRQGRVLAYSRHFTSPGAPSVSSGEPQSVQSTDCETLRLLGPRLAHGRGEAMKLAVRALELQLQASAKRHLSPRFIVSRSVLGPPQSESCVLPGAVVAALDPAMVRAVRTGHTRMLVVAGDATPTYSHAGLRSKSSDVVLHHQLRSHDLLEGDLLISDSKHWLEACSKVIEKHGIGLLAVGGEVSPLLWEHCLSHEVVVLKRLSPHHSSLLTILTGSEPVTYLAQCKERHIGEVVVDMLDSRALQGNCRRHGAASSHLCVVKPSLPRPSPVASVVLCGSTWDSIEMLERQFNNCLHRLIGALRDGCLLPGGGVAEAACIRELQTRSERCNRDSRPPFAMTTNWMVDVLPEWRVRVYSSFSAALRSYIAAVMRNVEPGLAVMEAHSGVEKMVAGLRQSAVLDVRESKQEGWQKAFHVARLTLQLSTPYH